ncbi:MAG TPA: DUF2129 domain-containing protein [Bacillota bacterium]|nr:DUF2129 domain-containing protein [Bacillota bacterium]
MRVKRQGLIVGLQHMKKLRKIKKLGHLIFASKRMKYAVLYVNQSDIERVEKQLHRYPFVTKVFRSYKPCVRTKYENALPDQAKKYDYKI